MVLETVSHADELVIAALVAGVSRSGVEMIGRSAGLPDGACDALIRTLDPALEKSALEKSALEHSALDYPTPQQAPATAVVIGTGETAELVKRLLIGSGVAVLTDEPDASPEIAVIVAHYVIEPEVHGRWLRRDIPHLAVVFGDEVVRVGPIIRPGAGPCLYCLELHRTDSDPSWPAIASQLWHRRSCIESSLVAAEAAATVVRLVLARRIVHRIEPLTTIEIDANSGERMQHEWGNHPECGCTSLTS